MILRTRDLVAQAAPRPPSDLIALPRPTAFARWRNGFAFERHTQRTVGVQLCLLLASVLLFGCGDQGPATAGQTGSSSQAGQSSSPTPTQPSPGSAAAPQAAPAPTAAQPAPTTGPDPQQLIDRCDEFASDPDDPGRMLAGVSDAALPVGRAIQACTQAVQVAPDNARIHYQLGRSLQAAARHDEAFWAFVEAADRGYPPAMKKLGDAYRWDKGLPSGESPAAETALFWYRKCVEQGSIPVCEVAVDEMDEYVAKQTFNKHLFSKPVYAEAIYTLDFTAIEDEPAPFLAYAWGMFKEMDSEQVVDHAPECIALQTQLRGLSIQIGGWIAVAGQTMLNLQSGRDGGEVAANILVMLFRFATDKDAGKRDTYNIVNNYGCKNPIGERLVLNLGNLPTLLMNHYSATSPPPTPPSGPSPNANPPSAGQSMVITAPNALNVRKGPGTQYAVVGRVYRDDKVQVQYSQDGWSYIGSGWVSSKFVSP